MSIYNFQCKEFDFENSKYLLENQNVCFSKTTNHAQASGFKKKIQQHLPKYCNYSFAIQYTIILDSKFTK